MQMKTVLDDIDWFKWNEKDLLGGGVGCGVGVVGTGGTKRRKDENIYKYIFFTINITFATPYVNILELELMACHLSFKGLVSASLDNAGKTQDVTKE